jgi:hypothetical protein
MVLAVSSHRLEEAAMKSLVTAALAAGVLLYSAGLAAEPVSAETVSEPLNTSTVQSSLEACIEGTKHPDLVKLVILIGKDGSMSLGSTIPPMGEEPTACLRDVVSRLRTAELDTAYKLVHAFHAPGPAAPTTVNVNVNLAEKQTKPKIDKTRLLLDDDYLSGRRALAAGIVMTSVGAPPVLIPMFITIFEQAACTSLSGGDGYDDGDSGCGVRFNPVLLIVSLVGVAVMGTGIGLIAVGTKKQSKATQRLLKEYYNQVSVAPFAGRESGGLALTMKF